MQLIQKILSEIEVIEQFIAGFDVNTFLADERTQRAVCMTLINIGELVKNLSENFKSTHTDIPWRNIAGMRDITAHKYQTLKMVDVWHTVEQDIPDVKEQLKKLIK